MKAKASVFFYRVNSIFELRHLLFFFEHAPKLSAVGKPPVLLNAYILGEEVWGVRGAPERGLVYDIRDQVVSFQLEDAGFLNLAAHFGLPDIFVSAADVDPEVFVGAGAEVRFRNAACLGVDELERLLERDEQELFSAVSSGHMPMPINAPASAIGMAGASWDIADYFDPTEGDLETAVGILSLTALSRQLELLGQAVADEPNPWKANLLRGLIGMLTLLRERSAAAGRKPDGQE